MNADQLRVAARAVRTTIGGEVLAWEPAHLQKTLDTLDGITGSGAASPSMVRAILGAGDLRQAGSRLPRGRETTLAVVPLIGILSPGPSLFSLIGCGTSLRDFSLQITAAAADPAVRAIVVPIDSPGGLVGGAAEASDVMRQARTQKPVLGAVVGVCASAAFWVSSNASRLTATPSGQVGSVGVYGERVCLVKRLEAEGVEIAVISAGKYKVENHPAVPITVGERQAFQQRVDETYDAFFSDVARGRGVTAAAVRSGYGEGRLVSATTALRLGMIDAVGTVDTVIAQALGASPFPLTAMQIHRRDLAQRALAPLRSHHAHHALAAHRRELAARVRD